MADSAAINYFLDQLEAVNLTGLSAADVVVDGTIQRFRPGWEPKHNKKRAWYILFDFKLDPGKTLLAGSFGWFVGADAITYTVDLHPDHKLSSIEKARFDQVKAEMQRKAEAIRQDQATIAAADSLKIWNGFGLQGHSAYLQRKKIAGINCRYSRESIVLPVEDVDGNLHGLQFIDAAGNKIFKTGTRKKGHFCPLVNETGPNGFIGVSEGYATGVSCHMATGWMLAVAFDAGNLKPVAQAIRQKYPKSKIVIFADDDFDNPDNPGRRMAEAAAMAVNGVVLLPPSISEVA